MNGCHGGRSRTQHEMPAGRTCNAGSGATAADPRAHPVMTLPSKRRHGNKRSTAESADISPNHTSRTRNSRLAAGAEARDTARTGERKCTRRSASIPSMQSHKAGTGAGIPGSAIQSSFTSVGSLPSLRATSARVTTGSVDRRWSVDSHYVDRSRNQGKSSIVHPKD